MSQKQFLQKTNEEAQWDLSLSKRELTIDTFRVLKETIWPDAQDRSILLAIDYCRARKLDPFKRPVHIVPVYSKKANNGKGGMVDTIWAGISELRTTATRTGNYAGKDDTVFGPDVQEEFEFVKDKKKGTTFMDTITYPSWAQVTLYRIVGGIRCAFVGPKVYWKEAYATVSRNSKTPNYMWTQRPNGQLDKVAEAGALRVAFPEELGNLYAAEEVEGKDMDVPEAEFETVEAPLEVDGPAPDEQAPPEEPADREPGEDDEDEAEIKPGTEEWK